MEGLSVRHQMRMAGDRLLVSDISIRLLVERLIAENSETSDKNYRGDIDTGIFGTCTSPSAREFAAQTEGLLGGDESRTTNWG